MLKEGQGNLQTTLELQSPTDILVIYPPIGQPSMIVHQAENNIEDLDHYALNTLPSETSLSITSETSCGKPVPKPAIVEDIQDVDFLEGAHPNCESPSEPSPKINHANEKSIPNNKGKEILECSPETGETEPQPVIDRNDSSLKTNQHHKEPVAAESATPFKATYPEVSSQVVDVDDGSESPVIATYRLRPPTTPRPAPMISGSGCFQQRDKGSVSRISEADQGAPEQNFARSFKTRPSLPRVVVTQAGQKKETDPRESTSSVINDPESESYNRMTKSFDAHSEQPRAGSKRHDSANRHLKPPLSPEVATVVVGDRRGRTRAVHYRNARRTGLVYYPGNRRTRSVFYPSIMRRGVIYYMNTRVPRAVWQPGRSFADETSDEGDWVDDAEGPCIIEVNYANDRESEEGFSRSHRRMGPVYYPGNRRTRSVFYPSIMRRGVIYYMNTRVPRAVWQPGRSFADETSDEGDWVDDAEGPCIIEVNYANDRESEEGFSRSHRRMGPVYYPGNRRTRSVFYPSIMRRGVIYYMNTRVPRAVWQPGRSFADETSDEGDWVDDAEGPCIIEVNYANDRESEEGFSRSHRRMGPVYYPGNRRTRSVFYPSIMRRGVIYYMNTRVPRAVWQPGRSFADETSDEGDWVDDAEGPCIIEVNYANDRESEEEFSRSHSRSRFPRPAATVLVGDGRRGRGYYRGYHRVNSRVIYRAYHSRSRRTRSRSTRSRSTRSRSARNRSVRSRSARSRSARSRSARSRSARSRSESTSTVYEYERTVYYGRRQTRPVYEYDGRTGTIYYARSRPHASRRSPGYRPAAFYRAAFRPAAFHPSAGRSFVARRRIIRTNTS